MHEQAGAKLQKHHRRHSLGLLHIAVKLARIPPCLSLPLDRGWVARAALFDAVCGSVRGGCCVCMLVAGGVRERRVCRLRCLPGRRDRESGTTNACSCVCAALTHTTMRAAVDGVTCRPFPPPNRCLPVC